VLTLSGPITGSGGLTVAGNGILRLSPSSGANTLSALTVNSGATLDITNSELLINYGTPSADPASAIAGYLGNGYNGGNWTGTSGIVSSTAAGGSGIPMLSVGYADGDNPFDLANVPGLQPNQIEIKYTIAGDALLTGNVSLADLEIVVHDFNQTGQDWAQGNFVYGAGNPTDQVSLADIEIVAHDFNAQLGVGGVPAASWSENAGGGGIITLSSSVSPDFVAVPEPGALTLLVGAGGVLLARRRHPDDKPRQTNRK
jgi:hypothetical protein